MKIKDERRKYSSANSKLRRARRLYVYINRNLINSKRNKVLDKMTERAKERGLYAMGTDDRSVRQSIITYLYRIERGAGKSLHPGWYEWLMAKGWDIGKGYSKRIMDRTG